MCHTTKELWRGIGHVAPLGPLKVIEFMVNMSIGTVPLAVCTSARQWGAVAQRRRRRALAWLVGAMEQVFLRRSVPGIIGFGRAHASAIPLR